LSIVVHKTNSSSNRWKYLEEDSSSWTK